MKLTIEELRFIGECLEKLTAPENRSRGVAEVLTPEERRELLKILSKREAEEELSGSIFGEG